MTGIEEKLKQLPDKPGVYLMKDKNDEIIYVGKAKKLKNRVRQYFQSGKDKDRKVLAMVRNIADFEYIIVDNEIESLILESNLIKEYKPRYNILLRDDKQYPYIKINMNERYPRVMKTRSISKDKAKYFGPYPSVGAVNQAIDIIRELYPIRNCNRNLEAGYSEKRPCLNYFIGKCVAPCRGDVKDEDYHKMIGQIENFLDGKDYRIINLINEKMNGAAKELDFENAARYRDQILALEYLTQRQKITTANRQVDQDIIAMARGLEDVCVQIFFIRDGKIIGREHYLVENTFKSENSSILNSFVKQFYSGVAYIPREIILETEIEESKIIENWLEVLKKSKVDIIVPKIGEKKKLVAMVKKNAQDMVNKYGDKYIREHRKNKEAVNQIRELIKLEEEVVRIESYDISNIAGTNSVGSMVVFENGEAKKSDYRRFKIKTVVGPDDYSSMEEVLTRRFKRGLEERKKIKDNELELHGFSSFPDLIMMDGGKGQVNIAKKVLDELGIDIPICGLVKDDFHNTRGIIFDNVEYNLDVDSPGHRFIYKVQEEAHRFAISYHRSLRSKDMFVSELDGIKGIGEKRKKELLKHFKSIDKIKKASVEEIVEVAGMNKTVAEELYNHFRLK